MLTNSNYQTSKSKKEMFYNGCLKKKDYLFKIICILFIINTIEFDLFSETLSSLSISPSPLNRSTPIKSYPELIAGVSDFAFQDKINVSGIVQNKNGEPLEGATVTIQGTTVSVITNASGNFFIPVGNIKDILIFTFVGYESLSRAVSSVISNKVIELIPKVNDLGRVVVVGYGTQIRSKVTAAISSVPIAEIKDMPVSNVATAMQGKIPGVLIQQTSGVPGITPAIKVRGFGSINAGNTPLIVLDGNIVNSNVFGQINSNEIESIDVLKDASSTAIYGSRGANGVILITTKKGKIGKPVLSLNIFSGMMNVTKKLELLNSIQFAEMSKEAANNAYLDAVPNGSPNDPNNVRPKNNLRFRYPRGDAFNWFNFDDPTKVAEMHSYDFQDMIFRTAMINNYELIFSGGSDKTVYSVSGNYHNEDGIIKGSGYKRYNFRTNVETKLLPNFKIGVSLMPTYQERDEVKSDGHWADNGVISAALTAIPMAPIYAEDGVTYSSQTELAPAYNMPGITNPIANITEYHSKLITSNLLGNVYGEFNVSDAITYRATANVSFVGNRRNSYRTSKMPLNQFLPPSVPTGTAYSDQAIGWLFNQILEYKKQFGKSHDLDILVGMESTKNSIQSSSASGSSYPNDLVETLNASASGSTTTATSSMAENRTVSYFTRINYSFANKYILNASLRRDGSSIFGSDRRWGSFPAISVGWRIKKEKLLQNIEAISEAKIRVSYGLSGNNAFSSFYPSVALLGTGNYVFNNVLANGLFATSPENKDLSWEKNQQLDFGLELGLIDNRLFIIADYYNRITKDLLLSVNVPTITGFTTVVQNIGKMQNRGLEFGVTSRNLTGAFSWTTSGNLSFNRNKVLALGPTGDPIRSSSGIGETNITMIGEPIGSFFGYTKIGIFLNQADLDSYPHDKTSRPGDVKYADINDDKQINANDRSIIGNNQPDFVYGIANSFSFKNFDLNVALQGTHGGKILNLESRFHLNLEGNQNQLSVVQSRWRSESDPGEGIFPRANSQPTGLNNQVSTRWIEDGSYLRIQNVTIGYQLPQPIISRLKLRQARIYLSAQNLFTWSKYLGYNPEVSLYEGPLTGGVDYASYPLARTISIGINIGL